MEEERHKKDENGQFIQSFALISLVLIIFILGRSLLQDVFIHTKLQAPVISSISEKTVNPKEEARLILKESEEIPLTYIDDGYTLKPLGSLSQSGIVLGKNTNFGIRSFKYKEFDTAAPIDLGIGWGESYGNVQFVKRNMRFVTKKTLLGNARKLTGYPKGDFKYNFMNVPYSFSHNHVIPASSNIHKALYNLKKYEAVKLDGYIGDIFHKEKLIRRTSLSLYDIDETSRGDGACDTFYITKVQVGTRVYQ